jgi:hypothetical protein
MSSNPVKKSTPSGRNWRRCCRLALTAVGAFTFIILATAGVLALSSCATTPGGIARESSLFTTVTNVASGAYQLVPALPPPERAVFELVLAAATAALAAWNTSLHRRVNQLDGNGGSDNSLA